MRPSYQPLMQGVLTYRNTSPSTWQAPWATSREARRNARNSTAGAAVLDMPIDTLGSQDSRQSMANHVKLADHTARMASGTKRDNGQSSSFC